MLFFKKLRNVLKIAEKPSEIYWVLFAELRQNQEDPASLRSTEAELRAVVSGGAGGTLAPLEFGSSFNPIPARGDRLCPPHYW